MLAGETVTVHRVGGTDKYGDPLPGTPSTHNLTTLAPFAPRYTSDSSDPMRDGGRVSGGRIFLPHGSDILPSDVVEVRGLPYEIDGEIGEWRPAAGTIEGGLEVNLKRAEVGSWLL